MPRYTHEVKERAFRIFYDTRNLSEVVRVLKREYPKISKATVHEWAQEKDARGLDWYERSKQTEIAHHSKIDDRIAGARRQIIDDVTRAKERLMEQVPTLQAKTLDGAIYALTNAGKFILEQTGADRDSEETARQSVSALLAVLQEDEEIGKLLEKRWVQVEKRFYEKLKEIRKAEAKK